MDDPLRALPLVKVVDVLSTQKEATAALGQTGLQAGKRPVSGVGLCRQEVLAAHAVEGMHLFRIVSECLWCGELRRVKAGPQPILIPEGAQAAFG
jgi:hypothetical protein